MPKQHLFSLKAIILRAGLLVAAGLMGLWIQAQTIYKTHGKIEDMEVLPGGFLLVGSGDGLEVIEAHKPDILFSYDKVGRIKPEELEPISGTPWVVLHQYGINPRAKIAVVNYFTGEELFFSKNYDWMAAQNSYLDPSTGLFLVAGTTGGTADNTLGLYDLINKKEIGKIKVTRKVIGGTANFTLLNTFYVVNDYLFIVTPGGLACIEWKKLEPKWSIDDVDDVQANYFFFFDPIDQSWFIAAVNTQNKDKMKTTIYHISSTGSKIWPKPVKFDGSLLSFNLEEQGAMISLFDGKNTGFNFIDKANGTKQWKRDYEMRGSIFKVIQKGDIYWVAGTEGIEIVDNKGKEIKKHKVGGDFEYFEDTPEGILYVNKKQIGMLDPQSFEIKGKPAELKDALGVKAQFNPSDGLLYLASDKEVFTITRDGQINKRADIHFEEKEYPTKIEFMADGILLTSAQNALKLSSEGKELFKVYYKSPGQSAGKKLLAGLGAAAWQTITLAAALQAGTHSTSDMFETIQHGSQVTGLIGNEVSRRFKATEATKDFIYILTMLDSGAGIVRIKKSDGTKDKEFLLNDKKPVYKLDEDFGVLYYKSSNNEIKAFDLR